MESRLVRWLLLFTSLTLVGPFTVAAPKEKEASALCKPTDEKGSAVAGRSKTLVFPDGRKITVIGHLAGDRQIHDLVGMFRSGEIQSMSDEDFNLLLNKILKENSAETESRSILKHSIQDYAYLKERLSQTDHGIGFVSSEGDLELIDHKSLSYRIAKNRVVHEYNKRKGNGRVTITQNELMDILLSSISAPDFVFSEDPTLEVKVKRIVTDIHAIGMTDQERLVKSAQEISAQKKNGLHFVEFENFNLAVEALQSVCVAEVQSAAAQASRDEESAGGGMR